MDVKRIEPIKKPLLEFDNVDEFNLFYNKHRSEIDAETTHILNKKYKIPGYRITKVKGSLCLKKFVPKEKNEKEVLKNCDEGKNKLIERIEYLEQKIEEIINYINNQE